MATAKAERLLNLVIALVNSPRYRTAAWIREKVAGYADAPTDEAFFRTFERDKQELRELGIPVQTPPDGIGRVPHPAGRVRAARAVLHPGGGRRAGAGRPALGDHRAGARRVRGAAQDPRRAGRQPARRPRHAAGRPSATTAAPSPCCSRGCAPSDPAFAPLLAAVRARRAVTFDYRKDPTRRAGAAAAAAVGAGVLSRALVRRRVRREARQERRTFRVSRIAGPVRAVGPRGRGARRPTASTCWPRSRPASSRSSTGRRRCGSAPVMRPGCAGRRSRRCPSERRSGLGSGDDPARLAVGHRPPDRRQRAGRRRRATRRTCATRWSACSPDRRAARPRAASTAATAADDEVAAARDRRESG